MLQWELSAVTPHAALEQLAIAIALRQVNAQTRARARTRARTRTRTRTRTLYSPNPSTKPSTNPNPDPSTNHLTLTLTLTPTLTLTLTPSPNPNQPGHADAPLEHAAFFVDLSCYVVRYPRPTPPPTPHLTDPAPHNPSPPNGPHSHICPSDHTKVELVGHNVIKTSAPHPTSTPLSALSCP